MGQADSPDVDQSLKRNEIRWEFATPAGFHHQGTIVRQILIFKEVCKGILGVQNLRRLPSDFDLMTIIRQTEYVMNWQSLGKCIGDQDDILPLRPIDLLTGSMQPSTREFPSDGSPTPRIS